MMQLMQDVPANVIGFRASGKVEKADYNQVFIPELDKHATQSKEINFIFVIETDIQNFSLGAFFADIKAGLKNFSKWNRMAIVTDQESVEKFTDLSSFALPGESKGFSIPELEEAKKWVVEE